MPGPLFISLPHSINSFWDHSHDSDHHFQTVAVKSENLRDW